MPVRRLKLDKVGTQFQLMQRLRRQSRYYSVFLCSAHKPSALLWSGGDYSSRIKASRSTTCCCASSTSSSNDEYEKYRRVTPEVIKLIQTENERTRQSVDQSLKDEIVKEIIQASASLAEAVPELGPTGQYVYLSDDCEGRRQYRRQHVESGEEQLVLDISFHEFQIQALSISVEETYLAYIVSSVSAPSEMHVRIRHLESGREMVLPTQGTTVSNVEWGPLQVDGCDSLFFTTSNDLGRSCAVHFCCVGKNMEISPSRCIYRNDDEAVIVDVQRTKGCKHMTIQASTKTSSEIYLIGNTTLAPTLVRRRQEGVLYYLDVGLNDDVFVLANAAEPEHESGLSEEMSLFETTVASLPLQSSFGVQYLTSDDEHIITNMDIFNDFIAVYERSTVDGRQRIRLKKRTGSVHEEDTIIPLPQGSGDCSILSSGGNMCYKSTSLRFRVESPSSAGQAYSFDTITTKLRNIKGEAETAPYIQRRVLVMSADGTKVPMSIIYYANYPMGNPRKVGRHPTILIGYGAYGEPVVQGFDPTIVPLLKRGIVVAYAHTRGGGELGRVWYRAGRLYGKERVIEDYIACAEALVGSLGISDRQSLIAKAFSAGGVTVAGAVNQRPSLFGGMVLINPFLDVTTSMTNAELALTEHEWDEWGDLFHDYKAARSISSYCPMSNVRPQAYPKMLLVGTMDDANVPFWHPLTFSIKIRKALRQYMGVDDCFRRVLLHIEPSGGHHLHGTKLDLAAMEATFIVGCLSNLK